MVCSLALNYEIFLSWAWTHFVPRTLFLAWAALLLMTVCPPTSDHLIIAGQLVLLGLLLQLVLWDRLVLTVDAVAKRALPPGLHAYWGRLMDKGAAAGRRCQRKRR